MGMSLRTGAVAAGITFVIAATRPAAAQLPGIPGTLDPRSGKFTPRIVALNPPHDLRGYNGTIVLQFNITIISSIPDNQAIECDADIEATDPEFSAVYSETGQATATRSGNTATCSVTIPFLWSLGAGATFAPGYTVSASGLRSSSYTPVAGKLVPANGTTATITYNVVL